MGPMTAISTGLSNFLNFSGTASRSEFFWMFAVLFTAQIVGLWIDAPRMTTENSGHLVLATPVLMVLALVPLMAVTARRLNDMGYSGRWIRFTVVFAPAALLAYAVFTFKGLTLPISDPFFLASSLVAFLALFPAWAATVFTLLLSLMNARSAKGST